MHTSYNIYNNFQIYKMLLIYLLFIIRFNVSIKLLSILYQLNDIINNNILFQIIEIFRSAKYREPNGYRGAPPRCTCRARMSVEADAACSLPEKVGITAERSHSC